MHTRGSSYANAPSQAGQWRVMHTNQSSAMAAWAAAIRAIGTRNGEHDT
jgi:hypothetical protein